MNADCRAWDSGESELMNAGSGHREFIPRRGGREYMHPFTGLLPIEEGVHYKFQRDLSWLSFEKELRFRHTALASCAGFIIRTREPASDVIEKAIEQKTDTSPDWADRSVTFDIGTVHLAEDVEMTATAIRPDLVLLFLHRVRVAFD